MAYLPSSSLLTNLKWAVDCHFWMFLSLVNTMALSPLQIITNPHTQIATYNSLYTTLDITNFLLLKACTINNHITDQADYCVQALALNGYPRKYFCGQWKTTDRSLPTHSFESFTSIPYIQSVSDKIQRILNEVGVKVVMKPHLTIRKLLPSLKNPLDNSEKFCLVYQVPCRDCSFVYIGQTKRDLKSRLDEHKRAIKNQRPDLSATL